MRAAVLLALSILPALAPRALAAGPFPGSVYVQAFTVQGDGCPAGSTAINVAPDVGAFTVIFGGYLAEAGGRGGPPSQWRNCLLDLSLAVPPGWTFTLTSVDYRGYADLGPGTIAQQISTLTYPPRTSFTRLTELSLGGPFVDNYQHHVDVPPLYRATAPCTGAVRRLMLRINTGVASHSGANAMMTVDSIDGVLSHSYRLTWRACSGR